MNLSVVFSVAEGTPTLNKYKSIVVPFTNNFGATELLATNVSVPDISTLYIDAYIDESNEFAVILAYISKFQLPDLTEFTPGSPTGVMKPPTNISVPGPFTTILVCVVTIAILSKS